MKFEISRHALEEMSHRRIPGDRVETILMNPQQVVNEYGNKKAYQSIIDSGAGENYLVSVVVNDAVEPAKVVTVYKTSKIQKYWRVP